MIPLLLMAELEEEWNRDWNEMRQFIVIKLEGMIVARFPAATHVNGENDRPSIAFCVADWLRKKLI